MFTIGIDPHKGSHLAAVLDQHEQFLDELRVRGGSSPAGSAVEVRGAVHAAGVGDRGRRGLGALVGPAARRGG